MILWLGPKTPLQSIMKQLILQALKPQGLNSSDFIFNTLHIKVPSLGVYPPKKIPSLSNTRATIEALSQDCAILKPKLIVCNDEATLRVITQKPYTLSQTRGSIYFFQGIPVLVLDKLDLHKGLMSLPHGKWVLGLDLAKLARYATGRKKNEPAFNFHLCKSYSDVRAHCDAAKRATLVSDDTETKAGIISVVSFTYDCDNHLVTFCVPFLDPWEVDGCYWADENEEIAVWKALRDLQASPVYKTGQNRMYDDAYYIEQGIPPSNGFFDTTNMMHALWCEVPKKLHQISSYFLDCYTYWKDDAKGMHEDNTGKTHEDLERYWRYNGLDTYYTWLSCRELVSRIVQIPWAVANYNVSIRLSLGPCLAASLRGLRVDERRHSLIMEKKLLEAEEGLADMRRLTNEEDFNPRSPYDVAWMIYDVFGEQPTRLQNRKNSKYGKRSTDEKVLKLIKERGHVVVNNFIDRLLRAKQPAAVISKYGNLSELCRNGRFLSWLNPTGTVTSRFNSGSSQFWTGTNAQNIPADQREYYVADNDYVLCEFDYGASDDRFIAYECQDEEKIKTVEDVTKDIHCKHCSEFFGISYDKIYQGWKDEEPWVVDSTTGVRQNTKRITHGRNYREGPDTMYNVMGRDAVVATAIALGHEKALKYTDKELIGICGFLIDKYDHPRKGMYKRIRPWQDEIVRDAVKNGNIAAFAYGFTRKFLRDLKNDDKGQRELSSCYGQSGTAGNINRALNSIWYSGLDDGRTCIFLLQVHDSLMFAIHRSYFGKIIPQIQNIMQEPTTIHGRKVSIPVSTKVGLTWSKHMLEWVPGLTYEQVVDFEKNGKGKFKGFDAKYPKTQIKIGAARSNDEIMKMFQEDISLSVLVNELEDEDEIPDLAGNDDGAPLDGSEAVNIEELGA